MVSSYLVCTVLCLSVNRVLCLNVRSKTHNYVDCQWDSVPDETMCHASGDSYSYAACKPLSDATGNASDTKMVWIPYGDVTGCSEPDSACRCFDIGNEFWYEQDCECYNPTPVPNIPLVGVIRWTGIMDYRRKDVRYNLKGEVHKMSNGDFMKKEYSSGTGITTFEILIADRMHDVYGTYTKYTGDTRTKSCKMTKNYEDAEEEDETLQAIWEPFKPEDDSITMFYNFDRPNKMREQVWTKNEDFINTEDRRTWTIMFNENTKMAVPKRYEHEYRNHDEIETEYLALDYKFSELKEGEKTFELKDYCVETK